MTAPPRPRPTPRIPIRARAPTRRASRSPTASTARLSTPIAISAGDVPTATISSPTDGIAVPGRRRDLLLGRRHRPRRRLACPTAPSPGTSTSCTTATFTPGRRSPACGAAASRFPTSGHDFSGNTRYRITLTVKDSTGLTSTKSVTINPTKVNLTFDTVPSGRTLYLDGIAKMTPFVLRHAGRLQPHDRGAQPDRREHLVHVRLVVRRRRPAAHDHRPELGAELHRDLQLDPGPDRASWARGASTRARARRPATPPATETTAPWPAPGPPGPRAASTAAPCRSTARRAASPCRTRRRSA